MGAPPWLQCETDFLLEHYGKMKNDELEAKLGRSIEAIYNHLTRLRKKRLNKGR